MDKFEEAWKANRHVWESTKNLAKAMYLAGEEAQQAKVEELQKRVDELEQKISVWKGKSIAALVNGMCKQCGKEPWQGIVSDKAGYTLLHCFGCGANKYEWVGEQALKGEGSA
ncbi:hypothetical protein [Acinetobacter pittii]|uniref:hypothetical protein n=1 Tax=Acinetobacter pittii TaxID=48296 RepID=UPI001D18819F|nr:hypothetical protein [Acinetobacter pittii]